MSSVGDEHFTQSRAVLIFLINRYRQAARMERFSRENELPDFHWDQALGRQQEAWNCLQAFKNKFMPELIR